MTISKVSIKNFRGIGPSGLEVSFDYLNLIIGDNGTSKTSILEAVNFCLSDSYVASRVSIDDFYNGGDDDIEITVSFNQEFDVTLPDGWAKYKVPCIGIKLLIKKRKRQAPGKFFSKGLVVEHYYLPKVDRGEKGWLIPMPSGKNKQLTERDLSITYAEAVIPRSFYFAKNREKNLQKGFGSSINSIIDELNWRFEKTERNKVDSSEKYKDKRIDFENFIKKNTEGDALKLTLDATNKKLGQLKLPAIDLSVVKLLTPYDTAHIIQRDEQKEIPVSQSGSGIEMMCSLVFLETLALLSQEPIIIVIDEPELHLHPSLQIKFADYLMQLVKTEDVQIILSSHSPFFFKKLFKVSGIGILMTKINSSDLVEAIDGKTNFGILKWSPSWGEICYFAYDLPTIEFHDDLYSTIEDIVKKDQNYGNNQNAVEDWLSANGQAKEKVWQHQNGKSMHETLMTYIRNRIHHPENEHRSDFSLEELQDSIDRMIVLIKPFL